MVTTIPVKKTTNNVRYFEYQCMRYVYNAQKSRFEPYEFDLGSTNRQLQGWAEGVTSEEAFQRLELLGPNLIRVEVPSIPRAIIQE
jgi:cation-transporting ATPase 13A3/4/5